eukprot:m.122690 g.122690  ORF g.122690 m.122690 type:complete len:88 (-) comp13740_c0_seq5:1317-1580(-)
MPLFKSSPKVSSTSISSFSKKTRTNSNLTSTTKQSRSVIASQHTHTQTNQNEIASRVPSRKPLYIASFVLMCSVLGDVLEQQFHLTR